jgi:hypothetical protein
VSTKSTRVALDAEYREYHEYREYCGMLGVMVLRTAESAACRRSDDRGRACDSRCSDVTSGTQRQPLGCDARDSVAAGPGTFGRIRGGWLPQAIAEWPLHRKLRIYPCNSESGRGTVKTRILHRGGISD